MEWLFPLTAVIITVLEYIRTEKPRKLLYLLIWAYYFIAMPIIDKNGVHAIIGVLYVVIGFIITLSFVYWDVKKTNKERASLH